MPTVFVYDREGKLVKMILMVKCPNCGASKLPAAACRNCQHKEEK